jgi:hypothetical protein
MVLGEDVLVVGAPKWVESDAMAVDDSPQIDGLRAVKVALAISIAIRRAASVFK